jgi:hypothetical protein
MTQKLRNKIEASLRNSKEDRDKELESFEIFGCLFNSADYRTYWQQNEVNFFSVLWCPLLGLGI